MRDLWGRLLWPVLAPLRAGLACGLVVLCAGCGTLTTEGWQSSEYARTKRIEAKVDSLRIEVRALRDEVRGPR